MRFVFVSSLIFRSICGSIWWSRLLPRLDSKIKWDTPSLFFQQGILSILLDVLVVVLDK